MVRFFPLPEPGDIVWCRFPHEGFSEPGPKPRPALIVDTGQLRGDPAIEVIYGTSQKVDQLHPGEFVIVAADGAPFTLSGLSYPTKFDTNRSVFLPYNDVWFAVAPGAAYGQQPKHGVLHPSLLRRVEAAVRAGKRR